MSQVKVTSEQVKKILEDSKIKDFKMDEKTTVVCATLPNGFVLVESSSCVDTDNYDHEVGKSNCLKRIEDKIWAYEGYLLQTKISTQYDA